MTRIALLPDKLRDRGNYINQKDLPCKYMEDFSLMGFIVDRFEEALKLTRSRGFVVYELNAGAEIVIEAPGKVLEIRDLFETHGINCSYADIADTLYQA